MSKQTRRRKKRRQKQAGKSSTFIEHVNGRIYVAGQGYTILFQGSGAYPRPGWVAPSKSSSSNPTPTAVTIPKNWIAV